MKTISVTLPAALVDEINEYIPVRDRSEFIEAAVDNHLKLVVRKVKSDERRHEMTIRRREFRGQLGSLWDSFRETFLP